MHAADRLAKIFWSVLETLSRGTIPRVGGQANFTQVDWLSESTFQQLLDPEPIKLRGSGLRSLVETSPAALWEVLRCHCPILLDMMESAQN